MKIERMRSIPSPNLNLNLILHLSGVQVFFPYVALYLGAAFLQGGAGTGANGFLNNLRGWLWIPISQSAYRTIALDLFSHVLDLDLKFHLMCVAPFSNP